VVGVRAGRSLGPPEGPGIDTYTRARHPVTQVAFEDAQAPCCAPDPGGDIPRRVIKGGSHLFAPSYCLRYRPAARQGEAVDTSTGHIGFRCIVRG
jgi:formylglycine-generating enzyme required for sulfatase activity